MIEHVDVAVAGAGVTGLAAAWAAEQQGATVALFEAGAECGGVIKSENADGFLVERGATSMTGSADVMQLLRRLSLRDDVIVPPAASKRRYIVRDGQLCVLPASPPGLLTTSALSWRAKFRVLREPWVSPPTIPPEAESLAQLVRRRFGEEVLDYIVDPFVNGVYAGDPERLSSRFALRMLSELEREHGSILLGGIKQARRRSAGNAANRRGNAGAAHEQPGTATNALDAVPHILSFRKGMQQLPQAIEAALLRPVRYRQPVTEVAHRDGQWQISSGVGTRHLVSANALIVALPSHQLQNLSWPDEFASALARVPSVVHAPVSTVALGFQRSQVAHPLNGFGVLIPHKEQRGILGALFNSSMFAGRAPDAHVLITCFVGGARVRGALTVEQAAQTSLSELAPLVGLTGSPVYMSSHVWRKGIPQFNVGHEAVGHALDALEAAWPGLFFSGSYRTGVAVGECLGNGFAVGARAASSGRQKGAQRAILAAAGPNRL